MKKILLAFITILFISTFLGGAFSAKAQSADFLVDTNIVLPESYIEYFDLNQPVDVWTDGNEFVIAEEERIVYFDGELYKQIALDDYSVSKVYKSGNFILFLSKSIIYTLSVSDFTIENSSISSATSFAVYENILVTNTSSTIDYYDISSNTESFSAQHKETHNLGYSTTALSISSDGTVYYAHESKIKKHLKTTSPEDEVMSTNIPNVRYTAFSDNCVYVSGSQGIYKIDVETKTLSLVVASVSTEALGNVIQPQGIFYHDNTLYICDKTLNAVSAYSEEIAGFNGFFITSEHSASNRLSDKASAIFAYENDLYVLDETALKVKGASSTSAYPLDTFQGTTMLAVIDKTICLAGTERIELCKINGDKLEPISSQTSYESLKNISAITTFENDFYILNNEIEESIPKAVIYKLSSTTKQLSKLITFTGRGYQLTCDLFGDIYVEVSENSVVYNVYKTDVTASAPETYFSSQEKFNSFYADYEGNLFVLKDENELVKIEQNGLQTTIEPELSENLPIEKTAKDMSVSWNNNKTYLLFDGFILSISNDDLGVSTPQKIRVPDEFSITLDLSLDFVTLKPDTKLFEIDLSSAPIFNEYFDYIKMSSQQSDTEEFVLLYSNERYSLIANANLSAIVRAEDTRNKSIEKTATEKTKYLVNDSLIYSYPLVKAYAKRAQANKNFKVTVNQTFVFNNTEFSLIEGTDFVGYVASSMLKNGVAENSEPISYTTYRLTEDAQVYPDFTFVTPTNELKKGTIVKVIEINDGKAKILLDDGYYYVIATSLTPTTKQVTRNVIVVCLLALSLMITCVFVMRKVFASKKDELKNN